MARRQVAKGLEVITFTLETFVVAIFAILPGFICAAARSILKPDEQISAGEWIAQSLVTSLVMNVIAILLFIPFHRDLDLSISIVSFAKTVKDQTGFTALEYTATLYLLAVTWGVLGGFASRDYGLRLLAYRFRLTPITPASNVFGNVLKELVRTPENLSLAGDPRRKVPWLRFQRKGVVVFGRVLDCSVRFEVNEPIEIFCSPAHLLDEARENFVGEAQEGVRGLYFRILPDDIVEVLTMPAAWTPGKA